MPSDPALPHFLRRLAALFYDLLIVSGVLMATSFAVIIARGGRAVPAGNSLYQLSLVAQVAAYFIYFWSRAGQTPGMRAWHLRVETADGAPPTTSVAALRLIAAVVAAAPAGLGFLWMLADAERRTWHDRLSGTRVVRTDA